MIPRYTPPKILSKVYKTGYRFLRPTSACLNISQLKQAHLSRQSTMAPAELRSCDQPLRRHDNTSLSHTSLLKLIPSLKIIMPRETSESTTSRRLGKFNKDRLFCRLGINVPWIPNTTTAYGMPAKSGKKRFFVSIGSRQLRPIKLHLLQLGLMIGIASMATHSIPANADIFEPILRILAPFKFSKNTAAQDQPLPEVGKIITEQMPPNPYLSSNPISDLTTIKSDFAQSSPSLINVMHAEFLASRGDIDSALALYKKEAFKNNATSVFERALSLSLRYEPIADSLEFSRAWQLQNPEHIPAQFYVAHLALKAYQYNLAGDILTQILEYDPQADLSEILIGIYPANEHDQRLLLETLQSLPKYDNPSVMVMQAGLLSQLGQPEAAMVSISRALKFQPDNVPFITLKADIIKQLMPYQEVLKYVRFERKRLDPDKSLYLYEIRYLLSLEQTRQAWELLIEAHNKFHDDEITLLAGLVSIDIEAYGNADELLSDLASSPAYTDQAYYYLAISAERQGDFNKAERYLANVMQESLILSARQKLVAIQLAHNQPDKALETLAKFSQQFEVYAPDCAIMTADILRQQNKIPEAIAVLTEVNRRFPDDTKLLFARAQLLDNNENAALKRSLLDRLILLNPENMDYKLSLAMLLFEIGDAQDIQHSLRIAQSILDIPYDNDLYNQTNYLSALNIIAADALSEERYEDVVNYLELPYNVTPTLDSGIILLRAYQGLNQDDKVALLFKDIQDRFALGHTDISSRLQSY